MRGEDIDRPADDCNSGRVGDIILLPLHQLYLDMSNIDIVVKKYSSCGDILVKLLSLLN